MLQKLERSHEAIIGYRAIGDITEEDYHDRGD